MLIGVRFIRQISAHTCGSLGETIYYPFATLVIKFLI
jgi:hypothetical protein